jgi:hypothetical protein
MYADYDLGIPYSPPYIFESAKLVKKWVDSYQYMKVDGKG